MLRTHRLPLVALLAVSSACAGGARETGQLALNTNARTVGAAVDPSTAPRVNRTVDAPRDEAAPALQTLSGRNAGRVEPAATTPVAAVPAGGGVPASGGYIVRGTGPRGGGDIDRGATAGAVREEPRAVPPPAPMVEAAPVARDHRSDGDVVRRSRADGAGLSAGGGAGESFGSGGIGARPQNGAPRRPMRPSGPVGRASDDMAVAPATSEVAAPPGGGRIAVAPRPVTPPSGAPAQVNITVAVAPMPYRPPPPPPPPPPVIVVEDEQATAGLLTAASVGDSDRRANYLEYLSRHMAEREGLSLDMSRRLRVRVIDAANHPVLAARVRLQGDGVNFTALTHADGGFDFYPNVHAARFAGHATLAVEVESLRAEAAVDVPASNDAQEITVRLPAIVAPPPPALDLAFAIDVTGSMGDELRYVNREIASIVHRVTNEAPGTQVRVGATFYRDRYDDAVVQMIPFTTNVQGFAAAMQGVTASGGGDYPEDMNAGLEAAMTRLNWSEGAAVRVLVVIADAPPQNYPDEQFTYRNAIVDAGRRGIRLLPVAASGANRTVEYLFRAMGAATSTPYVYLTDDSGVGGSHMEADTDRVAVERFNDLLTRLVVADLRGQGMHEPGPLGVPQG